MTHARTFFARWAGLLAYVRTELGERDHEQRVGLSAFRIRELL